MSMAMESCPFLETPAGAGQRFPRELAAGSVEAELIYALPGGQRPVVYMYPPPPGVPRLSGDYQPRRVRIDSARPEAASLSLDVHGFSLHAHRTALADGYDPNEVRAVYYPEMERLVREVTGAHSVLVFDHNVRSGPKARSGQAGVNEPVRRVHNDYTFDSAVRRVHQLLGQRAAERRLERRLAIINVWRPLFGPVQDTPLAVCDARSIQKQDLVAINLLYEDRVGENYNFAYNPAHRWYYVPDMQADEALLLKCYDSATDGRAPFTAHSAFDHPDVPPHTRPRESIEIRTLAFF
jgi:hypothetical protein